MRTRMGILHHGKTAHRPLPWGARLGRRVRKPSPPPPCAAPMARTFGNALYGSRLVLPIGQGKFASGRALLLWQAAEGRIFGLTLSRAAGIGLLLFCCLLSAGD